MFRRFWHFLVMRILWWRRKRIGRGNEKVKTLSRQDQSGWVKDVTGVVVWMKKVDEAELKERRRRFWRHIWRSIKEFFGARPDHADRYPHQIFNIELEGSNQTLRIENNLYTGRELKDVEKGLRVEVGGEFLPNERGGKIHYTHGRKGYLFKR